MKRVLRKTVGQECLLRDFLKHTLGLSGRQISQAKFRAGGILVNGEERTVRTMLAAGDLVEVLLEEDEAGGAELVPFPMPIEILYEDEDVLAVVKPAGLVVHPSHGHYQDSLVNALAYYYQEQGLRVRLRPVGRLDRETSGIMVFAKNQVAADRLTRQKRAGSFEKVYLAIVRGVPEPPSGVVSAPIGKMADTLMKMQVDEQGAPSLTVYETLRTFAGYALVRCIPRTGRTHQIRVHMAYIGHPLVGDQLYGLYEQEELSRAALHAASATFMQPFTGEKISLSCAMPEDMKDFTRAGEM